MSVMTRALCTKIKNGFNTPQKQAQPYAQLTSSNAVDSNKMQHAHEDMYLDIDIQEQILPAGSSSLEPRFPLFTVVIGLLDIMVLFLVYIVEEGTAVSSETWIKMGCKYVPCMKPLNLKTEQELYTVGLKSQCQSFLFPYQFFRFFTPIFLHGDITHLLSNLVYQALAGILLEGKYGITTLAFCYILFGFSANMMSALCNPKTISMGASGAVYGLLLFCIIDNTLRVFTITNMQDKIIQCLITLLVMPYFILSVFFDVDSSGHADHAAHIGGSIMGVLVAMLLCDMPDLITRRVPNGEKRIQFIALLVIIGYFITTLIIFYLFLPVHLK